MRGFVFFIACLVCICTVYYHPTFPSNQPTYPNNEPPPQPNRFEVPTDKEIAEAAAAKSYPGSPLNIAINNRQNKKVKAFLKAGATIRDENGLVHISDFYQSGFFDAETLELLIEGGLSPKNIFTGYFMAGACIRRDNPSCIKLIVSKGFNPNTTQPYFDILLVSAVKEKRYKALEALLKNHADPNLQDHHGNTALHFAAVYQDKVSAQILIKAGANPHLCNKKGLTPRDIAGDIQSLLKKESPSHD